jgi:hypothetical protein
MESIEEIQRPADRNVSRSTAGTSPAVACRSDLVAELGVRRRGVELWTTTQTEFFDNIGPSCGLSVLPNVRFSPMAIHLRIVSVTPLDA